MENDFLYKHFCGDGHNNLRDVKIQSIDRVNREEEPRDKECQWAFKVNNAPSYIGLKGLGHAILGNFSTDPMVIELTKI